MLDASSPGQGPAFVMDLRLTLLWIHPTLQSRSLARHAHARTGRNVSALVRLHEWIVRSDCALRRGRSLMRFRSAGSDGAAEGLRATTQKAPPR